MVKTKLILSILIVLLSTLLSSAILLEDDNLTVVAYADDSIVLDELSVNDIPEYPTTTTTTTTKERITTTKQITTTQTINTTKVNSLIGTMNISNYDKTYYLKQDDGTGKILNGNSYAMMDSRMSFKDDKMVIYAHSSKDGTGLFQYFQKYDGNKSFYEKHKYININYDNKTYKYEIFSVYNQVLDNTEETNEYYMVYKYYNAYIYNNVLQSYKDKSQYDTGVELTYNDKILVIQTCSMNPNYKGKRVNLLVMGKLIEEK